MTPPSSGFRGRSLTLCRLAVGYGERTVLDGVDLRIPARGVFGLLGPGGVGKSTLLRTLSRWNEALPSFWHRGTVQVGGRDLFTELTTEEARSRLALLRQKGRLYTATVLDNAVDLARAGRPLTRRAKRDLACRVLEPAGLWDELEGRLEASVLSLSIGRQRRLALARLLAGEAWCLLLDEPFRDLPETEADRMMELVRHAAERATVVLCSHNQLLARRVCDRVALLVAGRILEEGSREEFFKHPRTEAARQYLQTGNCWVARPLAGGEEQVRLDAEELERTEAREAEPKPEQPASARPAKEEIEQVRPLRPSEMHWVLDGLGGCQQPGLLKDLDRELAGLRGLGCDLLINLRQEEPPAAERLAAFGLESLHFPIVDMGVPTLEETRELTGWILRERARGRTVVLHCKAGLGRTGTLLACVLVADGDTAVGAIERVRSVNPRYIQSDVQLDLIHQFEEFIRGDGEAA